MYLCSSVSEANINLASMRNHSQELKAGEAAEMLNAGNAKTVVVLVGETDEGHASGSRTLDKRLNPNAPDFVPSKTSRVLAAKRINERK